MNPPPSPQVLLIRHAIAEDRAVWAAGGEPDEHRPLTDRGRRRMEAAARGLRRLVPELGALISSPLTRARQTAELLAHAYGTPDVEESEALAPGAVPEALAERLIRCQADAPVAVVGHEPDLGLWVAWALTGTDDEVLRLKKGGACLLQFPARPAAGEGHLVWLLPPRPLRMLGGGG